MQKIFDLLKDYTLVEDILSNKATQSYSTIEEALSIATIYNQDSKQIIVVKDNLYHAEQLFDHLSTLIDNTHIFVSEESKRIESIAASPEFLANRLAILDMLNNNENMIIVTHTAALLRYLPSTKTFNESILEFSVNKQIDYNQLKETLIQAGYYFAKRVDQPLTFSLRGEVLDIYSINYDQPIRIEFFDDIVESIRFFDTTSQLTIETVDKVKIIPASDILFNNEEKNEIKTEINRRLDIEKNHKKYSELKYKIDLDIEYLENNINSSNLYNYYALLENSASLLDYTNNPLFIINDTNAIKVNENLLKTETIDYVMELYDEAKSLKIFELWHNLFDILLKHKYVEIKNIISDYRETSLIHELDIPIRQFDFLIEEIIDKSHNNVIVLALNEAEIKEVKSYLNLNEIKHSDTLDLEKNGIYFLHKSLVSGFNYKNLYVYSSYELFNTKLNVTKFSSKFEKGQILSSYDELNRGDYIVHNTYGVGRYVGIETREINGYKRDFLKVIYRNNDTLHVPLHQFSLVRKFVSRDGVAPRLNKLGSNEWSKTKAKVEESVNELANRLVSLYSQRSDSLGYKYIEDKEASREFDNDVEFSLTNDQIIASKQIKDDMMSDVVMDRLLIGDVGFGKTEVSMRAAFLAVSNGKQVAFLCPTTILSNQHYETFKKRFRNFPVKIEVINRFASISKQKEIIKKLKNHEIDILIGTHRILSKDIKFNDLGLLIIDEEQRFGVEHKEIIKELKVNVDVLSLSATPIPRTLQMSLIGVRQMSTLYEPPLNRKPVQTYVIEKNKEVINQVIMRELARGGQVFYLHNNVENLPLITKQINKDIKNAKVAIAHGQMDKDTLEDVMIGFNLNESNVLVCTTIIETGIDISNANTIIIDKADTFGLSQLYQIRGRVGRSNQVAYAYLMFDKQKILSEIATKRLNTIKEFTQLGSGHKIAMRDLTIRGAGDMLGPKQSGFIDTVGIDMYIEMLNEAVLKAQGKEVIKQEESKILINAKGHIPEQFTEFDYDKITLYQDIDKQKTLEQLNKLYNEVSDYFGLLPEDINQLFEKKRLEIILTNKSVEGYREYNNIAEIIFTPQFSANIDGIKLFNEISKVNPSIKLSYKLEKIGLQIKQENDWISDIMKVLDTIQIVG